MIQRSRSAAVLLAATLLTGLAATSAWADDFQNFESPQVHPMDLAPDTRQLLVVNTADNRLEVFLATAEGLFRKTSVSVGLDPVTVRARSNQEAWVVNHVSDSISVVDLTRGTVVATIATDDEPADVVFAGSPERAYVTCSQANTVLVFDPANLSAPPTRLRLQGEDPRALAVSPDGLTVYAAIFESGNASTLLAGGRVNGDPGNVVDDPAGPYGGVNPPPNAGSLFNPPLHPATATPNPVGLIVKQDDLGAWRDDNGVDWSQYVSGDRAHLGSRVAGWDLADHDVAAIDTGTLGVTYETRLMNMVMAIAVNPATGHVNAVGTDGTNEVRFEPNLRGRFLRVRWADFASGASPNLVDLNPHLDYSTPTTSVALRDESLGDPRGVAWNQAGDRAYITGMGSDNLIQVDAAGARIGTPVEVGAGPTGVVLDESRSRIYVLNRFEATVSVIDALSFSETVRAPFFDPTPEAIRLGRRHFYGTHETSGLGHIACASCHVDGRHDRLSWDLGDPAAPPLNFNGNVFPAMKGPMRTQMLIDIVGSPSLHFRGDKADLFGFSGAFAALQGMSAPLPADETAEMQAFLAATRMPPNPYRNLDNSMRNPVQIPDSSGDRWGNPFAADSCTGGACHDLGNGFARGSQTLPLSNRMAGAQPSTAPPLRGLYEVFGLYYDDANASTAGFALHHDGSFDPRTGSTQRRNQNMAFLLAFNGDLPGDAHAAVGRQVTVHGAADANEMLTLNALLAMADVGDIDVTAKGWIGNTARGFSYLGSVFQSDHACDAYSLADMLQLAQSEAFTFTAVPFGSGIRIGIDRDRDGFLDVAGRLAHIDGSLPTMPGVAYAREVALDDPGLEFRQVADGARMPVLTAWIHSSHGTTWNPLASEFPSGIPDGENIAVLDGGGFARLPLSERLAADTTYTLTMGLAASPSLLGTVEVLAGDDVLVAKSGGQLLQNPGAFETVSITVTPTDVAAVPGAVGQRLGIRIIGDAAGTVSFDALQVTAARTGDALESLATFCAAAAVAPGCDDGLDNDGDGRIDWDGGPGSGSPDADCVSAADDTEQRAAAFCGLGPELALVLPLLGALRRRSRASIASNLPEQATPNA